MSDDVREERHAMNRMSAILEKFSPDVRHRLLSALVVAHAAEHAVVRAYERDRKATYRMSRTIGLDVPDTGPPHSNGYLSGTMSGTDVRDSAVPSFSEVPVSTQNLKLLGQATDLINYLNTKTGQHFRCVETNLGLVRSRLKSGATFEQCRAVIDLKTHEWLGTEDAKYLRPETLFGARKFEQYLGRVGPIGKLAMTAPVHLDAPIEWGQPGSLMRLWNDHTPAECDAVVTASPDRVANEQRALTAHPEVAYWIEVCDQITHSRKLRAKLPTDQGGLAHALDFDRLLSVDARYGVVWAVRVHDGHFRDG